MNSFKHFIQIITNYLSLKEYRTRSIQHKAGADVNIVDSDEERKTALITAAANGHYQCMELLIKAGADVNINKMDDEEEEPSELDFDNGVSTPWITATKNGHCECAELLIKSGVDASNIGHFA